MQARECSRQSFIVACQAAEARRPGKTAFDHPAPWQQHEATLRLWQFDDFQADAMCRSLPRRTLAGVALIDECDFDACARRLLYGLSQLSDLPAVLFICRRYMHR